ncbi:MAG TPA: hypothetical protein PKE30_12570 [Niabella sp.]|nr:hypothetical protein [Niabella sp.]
MGKSITRKTVRKTNPVIKKRVNASLQQWTQSLDKGGIFVTMPPDVLNTLRLIIGPEKQISYDQLLEILVMDRWHSRRKKANEILDCL